MPALAFVATLLSLLASINAPVPPPADDQLWLTKKTVDGVRLASMPSPRGVPWGLGEGDIAAPLASVAKHLTDFAALAHFLPRVAEVRVLAAGDHEATVYFRFDLPWPISDRDWTVRYRWAEDAAHFWMTWSDANDRGPPPTRAVRVAPLRGYWELTALSPTLTHARYVFLAELGGSMPASVASETAWKQPLETFRGIRKSLLLAPPAAR